MKRARWCGIVAVAVLPALVGCGGEGSTVAESDSSVPGDTSATASATLTATPAPTASESASSASSGGPTPGSSFSLPYGVGSVMSVIGVAHDDVLNLRTGPGTGFAVRRTLDPLATGLVATGRGWQVPGGPLWAEVTASGTTGWVSLRYLAVRDGTEDLTARAIERLGRRPSAGSAWRSSGGSWHARWPAPTHRRPW